MRDRIHRGLSDDGDGKLKAVRLLCLALAGFPLALGAMADELDYGAYQRLFGEPVTNSATGKPEPVIQKIVQGKMEKFYEDTCLYEQHYIKDETQTIGEMISAAVAKLGENITIRRFARFKVGELAAGAVRESADAPEPPKS